MQRLLDSLQRSRVPSKKASYCGFGDDTSQESALVRIPVDVLMVICDCLDQKSRILLSLTCKPLRETLSSILDLRVHDNPTKIRLLHHLELDHPQYLTCRSCAIMFKWKARKHANYGCPRTRKHSKAVKREPITLIHSRLRSRRVLVNAEIVDLISRASLYGPEYGLLPSVLNSTGKGLKNIPRTNEARWAHGRLLIAVRITMTVKSGSQMAEALAAVDQSICPHPFRLMIDPTFNSDGDIDGCLMSKCPYCLTDETMDMQRLEKGRVRFTVKAWQDCGNRDVLTQNDEIRKASARFGHAQDVLRRLELRNLRVLFESNRGREQSQ